MALDKPTLKAAIEQAFLGALNVSPTGEQSEAIETLAGNITDAIDTFVKSATVVHVLVAPAGGGPVTGEITIE
jgi:hypothetical protein